MDRLSNFRLQYFRRDLIYQYVVTYTGTLLIVCTGMYYGWPSPSLPLLLKNTSEIHITSSQGSWIAAIHFIGVPFGCILSALLVNNIGRKRSMLMASPILFLMWIVVAYAPSASVLLCARFFAGIGDGLVNSVLPIYIGEISDKRIRGLLGSSIKVASKFGVLAINVIGLHYSIKTTALIASVVPLVHLVGFSFAQESPHYHVLKNKDREAAESLRKLKRTQNVDTELSELTAAMTPDAKNSTGLLDIFKNKNNRKALGIILGLKIVEQLSGYHAIAFYCLTIFNESGGAIEGSTATIIYFSVQLVVATLSSLIVDITGRKPLLIIAVIGSGCSLAIEGIYFYFKNETNADMTQLSFVPLAALLTYTVTFNIGLTTIPLLMMGELFPTSGKAFSACITGIFYGLLLSAVSKCFQIVKDDFGMHVPFFVFALCCALGVLFIIYVVPETKGKSLEQIQLELTGSCC